MHFGTKKIAAIFVVLIIEALASPVVAQMQFVPTYNALAGTGTAGNAGDGGAALSATVSNGIRYAGVDGQGNVYFGDVTYNVVRRIDARTGVITTVAGTSNTACTTPTLACGDGGLATSATLNTPSAVVVDAAGNIYIADAGDKRVRVVSAVTGDINAFAGNGAACTVATYATTCGDGHAASVANLTDPVALAIDGSGNLYIGDGTVRRIRVVNVFASTPTISLYAGNGNSCVGTTACGDAGAATAATFTSIGALGVDSSGNLYVSDFGTYRVRMILAATVGGIVHPIGNVAGTGVKWTTGTSVGDGGPATSAEFGAPYGLAFDSSSNSYIADASMASVQKLPALTPGASPTFGNMVDYVGLPTNTLAAEGGLPQFALLHALYGMGMDVFNNMSLVTANSARVQTVTVAQPLQITNVGATATTGISKQIYNATLSASDTLTSLSAPSTFTDFTAGTSSCSVGKSVALVSGTTCTAPVTFTPKFPGMRAAPVTFTDSTNNRFIAGATGEALGPMLVLTPGTIDTLAGTGTAAYMGDGGPSGVAALSGPTNIAADSGGNLYIADSDNNAIRLISGDSNNTTVYSTANISTFYATGLNGPKGVAVDAAGNVYIADTGNNVVRVVNGATGVESVVAGIVGSSGYNGDGGLGKSALLKTPVGLSVDTYGVLYIADTGNNVIRALNIASGVITTVVGTGTASGTGDGGQAIAATLSAPAGVFYMPPPAVQSNSMSQSQKSAQLLIADTGNNKIRVVNLVTDIINTVAGNGSSGYTGDGGAATSATLNAPAGMVADAAGNIYIADTGNFVVRQVNASTSYISTVAGTGDSGYTGDDGAATVATFMSPFGIAINGAGTLYIADPTANVIRENDVASGSASFGNVLLNNTSALTVIATNAGNEPLVFSAISAPTDFAYIMPSGNDCTATTVLAASVSCTMRFSFTPTTTGAVTGDILSVTTNTLNVAGTVNTVALTGNGVSTVDGLTITPANISAAAGIAQSITVTATNSDATATTYTGTVQFHSTDGSAVLPAAYTFTSADAGVHTFYGLSFASAGSQTLTVTDNSSTPLVGSASVTVTGVLGTATTTSLVASQSAVSVGEAVMLTATVASTGTGTPTGTVSFQANSASLGTATLTGGAAAIMTSVLPLGMSDITATYVGNASFATSTSPGISIRVSTFSIWITNGNNTISAIYNGGTPLSGNSGFPGGGAGIAINGYGDIWSGKTSGDSLTRISVDGVSISTVSGGGLSGPTAVAASGNSYVWVTNSNNSLSLFTAAGTAVSPSTGYTGGGLSQPGSLTVDSSGNVWIANDGNSSLTEVIGAASPMVASPPNTPSAGRQIASIAILGSPLKISDHTTENNIYPDAQQTAWKEADGTVNFMIAHDEAYRMRGPDLEHLTFDSSEVFSSSETAFQVPESLHNYVHTPMGPYSLDGVHFYSLTHSEWYACVLNNTCNAQSGNAKDYSWVATTNQLVSSDGGASWKLNTVAGNHVVADPGYYWTDSPAAQAQTWTFANANNHTGLFQPTRVIEEGGYYYALAYYLHRNFSAINPAAGVYTAPVDKQGNVIIRTRDIANPNGWEAWLGGSSYGPFNNSTVDAFYPIIGGQTTAGEASQIIYDTNAQEYILIFTPFGNYFPVYYITTKSLAKPVWSVATAISGTGSLLVDPAGPVTGFGNGQYVSIMDDASLGYNFETTSGNPRLYWNTFPVTYGGNNTARDIYSIQLIVSYQ